MIHAIVVIVGIVFVIVAISCIVGIIELRYDLKHENALRDKEQCSRLHVLPLERNNDKR